MISYNINKKKEIILDDVELSIDIYNNNEMNQLFDYKGGYGLQRITINKYDFTNTTNLYLIRVSNDYVNGNTAYENGNSNYAKELTESIYMEIDFPFSNNYYPITSWHQVHNYYFELKSQLNSNGTILLNDNLDLFEGASIEKKYDAYNFIYEGKISDYLFDYNYDNVLRKCTINNNPWNSSWKYDMVLTYQNFLLIQFRIIFSRNS